MPKRYVDHAKGHIVSRARRQRVKTKDRIGIVMLTVCLVAALTAGYFVVHAREKSVARNELGCTTGETPDHLVILLDRSDALLPLQKTDARRRIESYVANSGTGTRTSLWVLDPRTPELITKLFEGCQPRNGRSANVLIENERRLRARWRNEFIAPLYNSLNDALSDEPADQSPLMEAVQRIGVFEFDLDRNDIAERRLLILSDLVHHTARYSQYRDACDFDAFKNTSYAKSLAAPLNGVDVDVLYVGRPGQERVQTNCHGLFWEQYFADSGARLRSINRLAGG